MRKRTLARILLAVAAVIVALVLGAPPVLSQAACGERKLIVATLLRNHQEVPVARGLATEGAMIEVLAAESGTFTVLLTRPTGVSCLIAAGDWWETLPEEPIEAKINGSEPL